MNKPLTYGSVCSGMEAASLAWAPLGWKCAFLSEIEKAPSALLAQRYPDVPNFGDMTKFEDWPDVAIDLLAGGTPCQSFSVAGLRKGITDPRGSLMLTYGAIAKRYRPTWLFWENVPGVLSSNGGRDFGAFLGMLAELGYGFAYRVLDAQYFNLAQRRARVFVVGYLGDWRPPAAVLFERESLRGDSAPRRETGEGVAATVTASAGGCSGKDDPGGRVIARALTAHAGRIDGESETFITHALTGEGFDASEDGTGRGTPIVAIQAGATRENPDSGRDGVGVQEGIAYTLEARAEVQSICQPYTLAIRGRGDSHELEYRQDGVANAILTPNGGRRGGIGVGAIAFDARQSDVIQYGDMSGPIDTDQQSIGVLTQWAVRRLTPLECERLQGAPDDYTNIAYRGRNTIADGPRYKMIGNSWAVPCVRWIGSRIDLVGARLNPVVAESADAGSRLQPQQNQADTVSIREEK